MYAIKMRDYGSPKVRIIYARTLREASTVIAVCLRYFDMIEVECVS